MTSPDDAATGGPRRRLRLAPAFLLWTLGLCVLLGGTSLVLYACRGEAADDLESTADAAEPGTQAVPAKGPSPAGTAAEVPGPPPPAPALNHYAENCLGGDLADDATVERVAPCMESLLETLRAVIGVRELPQVEVGPHLDDAEVAVRRLSLDSAAAEAAALTRQSALDLVDLAGAVAAFVDGMPADSLAAARAAAEAIDPETRLDGQGDLLAAFFQAADDAVRPVVRSLSAPAPAGAPIPPRAEGS